MDEELDPMEQQYTSVWAPALLAIVRLWGEDVAHDRQRQKGGIAHAWTRERHTVRTVAALVALLARRTRSVSGPD